jgi:hypothetical protein
MPREASSRNPLNDEVLLKGELEYIMQTAFQANEDRARVSSFYLVAVGSLVAALFSTQLVDPNVVPGLVPWAFFALFFVLTVLGTLTLLQLARLRATWHDSMLAMNQIKDYWIQRSADGRLKQAFRWDAHTLPRKFKVRSVSYYQALEVALLSGLTFGTGVYFLQRALHYDCPVCNWAFAFALGILAFLLELVLYRRALGDEHAS